jgi:hypothetical protein
MQITTESIQIIYLYTHLIVQDLNDGSEVNVIFAPLVAHCTQGPDAVDVAIKMLNVFFLFQCTGHNSSRSATAVE